MSVAMLKSLVFTFCTPDGESGIAVQKYGGGVKSLSIELGTDNRSRIGFETWGDNSAKGDVKVDNKVDNNARGDINVDNKVDNNVGDDTVNDTVKHPQIRTRTTPVQHPYNETQFRTTTVPIQDTSEVGCRHDDGHAGRVTLPGATIATGTFGDTMTFEAQRNFWKDEGAGELFADWVGEYAWTAPDGGKLTLALNAAGAVKVTGKLGNGRALSLSLPLAYRNDAHEVLIYAAPATVKVKRVTKKYPEFIATVKLVNEPGMSEAGGDIAYRYR